jgi:S-(hydroxymethyl)glutathione dehydrogenase/alcohol dehydrogenase
MKVKGAVCKEMKKPLIIEDLTMDAPGPGKVKIRVAAAAICGSDIHSVKGEHGSMTLPAVFGHEVSGYVEEIGEGVTYVQPGDAVVCTLVKAGCGQCYNCLKGNFHLCMKYGFEFNQPSAYLNKEGVRLGSMAGPYAGFVEYTLAPEQCLVKIPKDIPMDSAALIGCGVISGFYGVLNAAKAGPFESVVVMGAGGVGLNALQGANFVGAHPVIAIDTVDYKLDSAKGFGATHTINSKTEKDPVAKVKEITGNRGADYVIVTVAGIEPKRVAFNMLGRGGTCVFIGHGVGEMLSKWDAVEFVGGKVLTGSAMGRINTRLDIPNLIEIYKAGRLNLDELISNRYPLEKINEAIASTEGGGALRNVIMFE